MIQVISGHGKRSSGASDLNPDAQQSYEHDQRPEVDMKSGGEVGSAPPLFTPKIVASAPHYETLAMSITHSKDLLFGSLLLIPLATNCWSNHSDDHDPCWGNQIYLSCGNYPENQSVFCAALR